MNLFIYTLFKTAFMLQWPKDLQDRKFAGPCCRAGLQWFALNKGRACCPEAVTEHWLPDFRVPIKSFRDLPEVQNVFQQVR